MADETLQNRKRPVRKHRAIVFMSIAAGVFQPDRDRLVRHRRGNFEATGPASHASVHQGRKLGDISARRPANVAQGGCLQARHAGQWSDGNSLPGLVRTPCGTFQIEPRIFKVRCALEKDLHTSERFNAIMVTQYCDIASGGYACTKMKQRSAYRPPRNASPTSAKVSESTA